MYVVLPKGLRDHNGMTIRSSWGVIPHCQGATMAEAIACLKGLEMALVHSNQNLIIETDCTPILDSFSLLAREYKLKGL